MSTLKDLFDPNTLFKKAHDIAKYYGFSYLPDVLQERKDRRQKIEFPASCTPRDLEPPADIFARASHALSEHGALEPLQPLLVWGSSITPGRPNTKTSEMYFLVFGAEGTLADAFLMRTASAFAEDLGGAYTLGVTSLGDTETRERHQRDFTHYVRKHIAVMHPDIQAAVRRDPKKSYAVFLEHLDELPASLPTTLEHLSESARARFEELLERLDQSDTPYELSPHLFDPTGLFSHTQFSITSRKGFSGHGARFSDIVQKFNKKGRDAIGVSFTFKTKVCPSCKAPQKSNGKPLAVFIQLGPAAKHISFSLLDELRSTRIPLIQTIPVETMGEQMGIAESSNAPYYLIVGHKEALEGTVILRDVKNQAQEVVPRSMIIERVRSLA